MVLISTSTNPACSFINFYMVLKGYNDKMGTRPFNHLEFIVVLAENLMIEWCHNVPHTLVSWWKFCVFLHNRHTPSWRQCVVCDMFFFPSWENMFESLNSSIMVIFNNHLGSRESQTPHVHNLFGEFIYMIWRLPLGFAVSVP